MSAYDPKRTSADGLKPYRLRRLHYNHVTQSAGDTQLLLDVGHHWVRQTRLAEFCKVIGNDALPCPITRLGHQLPSVSKVEGFSFISALDKHEHVRPVGFNHEVVGKKRVGTIDDRQCFCEISHTQGIPCHVDE